VVLLEAPVDSGVSAAALRCIARWGVAKTSLDDVAREAGVSRATVYRAFPGGKDALIESVARAELVAFHDAITARLEKATSLEELLVAGVHEAGRRLVEHRVLQVLLAYEPELILPHVSFAGMDRLLSGATELATPWLERWLDPPLARRTAEWVTRLVISYATCPSDAVDLCDESSVRQLVATFVLPALSN
jgi:AcrR family transcriptional regulator